MANRFRDSKEASSSSPSYLCCSKEEREFECSMKETGNKAINTAHGFEKDKHCLQESNQHFHGKKKKKETKISADGVKGNNGRTKQGCTSSPTK